MMPNNKLWIDTRLTEEEMDFLNQAISEENKTDHSKELVGNISKSETLMDKDNWFYETTLKKLSERMFYRDWNNYCRYRLENEKISPKFELESIWVNYMKQHEFNPIHYHDGLFSFVIFMKIPTHWKEQHALPRSVNSSLPCASNFTFLWSEKDSDRIINAHFPLCPENEGRMLFFPAWLSHQVYPFYETEEERVTISGNIRLYEPNRPKIQEVSIEGYEEKKNMLEMMEKSVEHVRKELKEMKKAEEKEE